MNNSPKPLLRAISICIFIVVGTSQPTFSQGSATPPIASFLIMIETTADGFTLICKEGCAWKELSFPLNPYRPQFIDQWGMTSTEKHEKKHPQDASLANFLFTIKKVKDNGVSLEGKEGTAWTQLDFRDAGEITQGYINAYGTTKPE